VVIGSVGLLIRAYHLQLMNKLELEGAMELLFNDRSLHISRAFRAYVDKWLNQLC
jgi:hypothetical protein